MRKELEMFRAITMFLSFSVQGTGPQVEEASEKQCTNQIFNLKVAVLADEVDDR